MRNRNWLVEDNLVALYLALYGDGGLPLDQREIHLLIGHRGFPMRVQQYVAIHTNGKAGLPAGLRSPLFRELYRIGSQMERSRFRNLVRLILDVKQKIRKDKESGDTRSKTA